tara:strand:- start:98 stop:856 length:759 start_codon:yes stop_codon:yes gene_type:complete
MAWPVTAAAKGIMQALKRKKPKPKVNRRRNLDELTESDKATEFVPPYMPGVSSQAMRAKQVGDETMMLIRRSVSKMDLPPAKIPSVLKSIEEMQSRLLRIPPAQLAKMDPSVLVKNFILKYRFPIGAAAGYGVADNKEAIAEMLKSVKLPTKLDVDLGMTPAGDIFGGAAGAAGGALLGPASLGESLWERNSQISDDNPRYMFEETTPGLDPWDRMTMFGSGYDEPDPEPGLGQGMLPDLFLDPLLDKMFGD